MFVVCTDSSPNFPYTRTATSCSISGWWGFIFPLGVWINCTYALAKALLLPFLSWVGIVALCSLILLFLVGGHNQRRHYAAAVSGALLRPRP